MAWLDNHQLAESECKTGWEFEDYVATTLRAHRLDVYTPPKSWRADVSQRHGYANELDMLVNGMRVSVKSRRVKFTRPDDIPSNRNPLFVDTVRKWDLKDPEPSAVICISQETRAIIWLPTASRPFWGVKRAFDQVRSYADEFMTADRSLWYSLDDLVQQAQHAWDGVWELVGGKVGVAKNTIVHTGTDPNLRWLVGQKFYELLPHATVKPTKVTNDVLPAGHI